MFNRYKSRNGRDGTTVAYRTARGIGDLRKIKAKTHPEFHDLGRLVTEGFERLHEESRNNGGLVGLPAEIVYETRKEETRRILQRLRIARSLSALDELGNGVYGRAVQRHYGPNNGLKAYNGGNTRWKLN